VNHYEFSNDLVNLKFKIELNLPRTSFGDIISRDELLVEICVHGQKRRRVLKEKASHRQEHLIGVEDLCPIEERVPSGKRRPGRGVVRGVLFDKSIDNIVRERAVVDKKVFDVVGEGIGLCLP